MNFLSFFCYVIDDQNSKRLYMLKFDKRAVWWITIDDSKIIQITHVKMRCEVSEKENKKTAAKTNSEKVNVSEPVRNEFSIFFFCDIQMRVCVFDEKWFLEI